MLSKGAFNALLKTLEEPPGAREVHLRHHRGAQGAGDGAVALPALRPAPRRRAGADRSTSRSIVAKEGGEAEDDALALIARAAEGSVRDGLSLLDQALAMGAGSVEARAACAPCWAWPTAAASSICWSSCSAARPARRSSSSPRLHRDGAEPQQMLADLAEAVHVDDPRQDAGRRGGRRGAVGRGAAPRRRARRAAVGGDPVARLADAAQGPGGGRRCAQPGGRRRDGADPPRLYRRPAAAGRDHQGAGRRRSRRPVRGRQDRPQRRRRGRRPATPVDVLRRPTAATRATSATTTTAPQDYGAGGAADRALVRRRGGAGRRAPRGQAQGPSGRARQPRASSIPPAASSCICWPARPRSSPTSCARSSTPGPASAGWWR